MFTGIIEAMGRVLEAVDLDTTRRFTFRAEGLAGALRPGDWVAGDGACLTAVAASGPDFSVDVIGTTLERTIAGGYGEGTRVNLERAMVLGARLDGHLVQGHVDGVGRLERLAQDGEYWLMDFKVPDDIWGATVLHGSIALNGVSLTVSELPAPGLVRIGIIPFTWEHTNLGGMRPGAPVNVEGDLIGKYVGRILATRGS